MKVIILGHEAAFTNVGGTNILSLSLLALNTCPRLAPLSESVIIGVPRELKGEFRDWMGRWGNRFLKEENFVYSDSSSEIKLLVDVYKQRESELSPLKHPALVLSSSLLLHPGFPIARFVNTMIASRDNGVALAPLSRQLPEYPVYIASTSVPEVYPQVVKIEKKLASLDALTVGPVDLVVPMWALKNETMMILAQFEDSGKTLIQAFQELLSMDAIRLLGCPTTTAVDFCEYGEDMSNAVQAIENIIQKVNQKSTSSGDSIESLLQLYKESALIQAGKKKTKGIVLFDDELRRIRLSREQGSSQTKACSDLFSSSYFHQTTTQVPERFLGRSDAYNKIVKEQHPIYVTQNAEYGRKPPKEMDAPLKWHGIQGKFTSQFSTIKPRDTGIDTYRVTSRIHQVFDDF